MADQVQAYDAAIAERDSQLQHLKHLHHRLLQHLQKQQQACDVMRDRLQDIQLQQMQEEEERLAVVQVSLYKQVHPHVREYTSVSTCEGV